MTLSWKAPADDGGAPVTKYVIKRRKADSNADFEAVCEVDATQTTCVVSQLQEQAAYYFALEAVNSQGAGEPLIVDAPVKTKAAISKMQ